MILGPIITNLEIFDVYSNVFSDKSNPQRTESSSVSVPSWVPYSTIKLADLQKHLVRMLFDIIKSNHLNYFILERTKLLLNFIQHLENVHDSVQVSV